MYNSGTQLIIKPQADLYFDYICTNLKYPYQKSILINISVLISSTLHSPNWMHIVYLSIYLPRENSISTVAISLLWKQLKTRRLLGVAPLGCCSLKCR